MQQYLTIWDVVLTPIYLVLIVSFARIYREKKYPAGHPLRPYYLPGLYAKLGGAIFIGLVYQYYYKGGDTFNYFIHAKIINSSLNDSFATWFDLIRQVSPDKNPHVYRYSSQMEWYGSAATYTVAVITAVFGLFNGTSYMPIALLFAWISFSGIWAMYKTFVPIYPQLKKPLALAFLFIPSVVVWGSSIFKDTICIFGLGWMVYCTFRVFVNRDFSLKNFLLLIISFYLIAIVKIYILLAFMPALALWILMTFSQKISSSSIRLFVRLLVIGVVIVGFVYISQLFSNDLNRYSLDNITKTMETTRGWIVYSSGDEGSAYDLGQIDPSFGGMLSKFPAAITVTLFRPFLWEAKKPIMLLSSLEGSLFFILVVLVFYRNGLIRTFRLIFTSPNLLFFFIYSLIFAFAVGISTGNFGTLSRYKIPCMPFFGALLLILYYHPKSVTKKVTKHVEYERPVHSFA